MIPLAKKKVPIVKAKPATDTTVMLTQKEECPQCRQHIPGVEKGTVFHCPECGTTLKA